MGVKNIYERFVWFDDQVRVRKYPNATTLAEKFEISTKTAQRDIDFMRDRLLGEKGSLLNKLNYS